MDSNSFISDDGRAVPILVETDKDTGVIDLNGVGQAIESGVKAIIPVHLNGVSCRTEVIKNMIGSRQITVIEDAAQAFMSRENEVPLGTQGDTLLFNVSDEVTYNRSRRVLHNKFR